MSKQERRRVRVAASLGLTVLMSSAILGGMAPLAANAAEVGSEPTTTEVSPMITAPENPSDGVVSLPEGEGLDTGTVDETPLPDEESEEVEAETPTGVPETAPEIEETLPEQSRPEPSVEVPAADAVQADEITSDEDGVLRDTWGDVEWTFEDGVLSLNGGVGVNTDSGSPWYTIANEVTKVVVTDTITAPEDISYLFEDFSAVTAFEGLDRIDTSAVKNMRGAFENTTALTSLNLTGWEVASVTDMGGLFAGSGLISVNLSTWQPSHLTTTRGIFSSMERLEYLNISSFSFSSSANVFDNYAPNLRTLVLGSNTLLHNLPNPRGTVWAGETSENTFSNQYTGGHPDTYHLEFDTVEDLWGTVEWKFENGVLFLSEGTGADTNRVSPWRELASYVETVVLDGDIIAPADNHSLFAGFDHVTEYQGLDRLNLEHTTTTKNMFKNNRMISFLDVADWDTSNVGEMWSMFEGCSSLTQLNIEDWNVDSIYDLDSFLMGTKLESIDLSKWHISDAYLYDAFASMSELKSLDISNFDLMYNGNRERGMISNTPQLSELTLGHKTLLWGNVDFPTGQHWQGDNTGHQFSYLYGGGYADTYRLVEGALSSAVIYLHDDRNEKQIGWQVLSGEPGSTVALSTMHIPNGYVLENPEETIELSENATITDEDVLQVDMTLKRVHKTTTRTIKFEGLPDGHEKEKIQEIKWDWDWADADLIPQNGRLFFFDDLVHSPLSGYEEFTVPEVQGYVANVSVVEAKEFEDELAELPDDEEVVITYTKLDTGDGGDQQPDPNQPDKETGTGSGSNATDSGGGQMTNLSTGEDKALPHTGSQVASGLTLLGLGLLGLLGLTKRRKRN
ncbi:BspA family leucine-rich repeat surface protein [Lacticaseibacillus suilingensis]|uniref:BspA family leucine-rich repeat surface protein n=1 Tax=Lacticaseibacillus suilingensis TaxID=2799577 RepID=A0ABW4BFY3_9LACO|nr:BspA family leucine-rich repeat surface protein [Lacticaseibacillus suilingensis]